MYISLTVFYNENGTPNAMNAAWGGISEANEISICISAGHKTTKNILERKAFTVSMADAAHVIECDYLGIASGNKVTDKIQKAGFTVTKSGFVDAPVITGSITWENERAADGCSWFVSGVKNEKEVASARWMTTGLGVYDIYVNGTLVGDEFLKPGFTHYAKTRRSFTYDVTDLISKKADAENFFSAEVTPGWWADKIITPGGHDGMLGKKVAFRSVLELTYSDGSKEYFGTNTEDWKAGIAGPVKHAAIFDGEEYDARELPGYAVADVLGTPEVNTEFSGEILPSEGAEIYLREDLALEPKQAYTWSGVTGNNEDAFGKVVVTKEHAAGEDIVLKPGETLVVDFGQNSAAVPEFEFSAKAGTQLTCLPGELLNDGNGAKSRGMDGPEGSVHRLNLRIPDKGMILKYTFGDNQDFVTYSPRRTFYG